MSAHPLKHPLLRSRAALVPGNHVLGSLGIEQQECNHVAKPSYSLRQPVSKKPRQHSPKDYGAFERLSQLERAVSVAGTVRVRRAGAEKGGEGGEGQEQKAVTEPSIMIQ